MTGHTFGVATHRSWFIAGIQKGGVHPDAPDLNRSSRSLYDREGSSPHEPRRIL
jgi:hypothetical protein